MKSFSGKVLCLDRSDINTDEIIPARYLTEIEKRTMGPHLMEDLKLDGFDPGKDLKGIGIIAARDNFGCGSSREHAPWALEANGINAVIATGFARIFRQNMFNCGMLAITVEKTELDRIFEAWGKGGARMDIDVEKDEIKVLSDGGEFTIGFRISEFDKRLIRAGGWVDYADQHY